MMRITKTLRALKRKAYSVFGKIDIPKELLERNYPILIHLTDTPTAIYGEIEYLIGELKPEYIIHTGDLVDNVKLELSPQKIDLYEKFVKKIISILEKSSAIKIWICMGNHDSKKAIRDTKKTIIEENIAKIDIENSSFCISHFGLETRECHADFHLFGHDMMIQTDIYHGEHYLNGLESINIIDLKSKKVWKIEYPKDTNDYRLNKYKIGI